MSLILKTIGFSIIVFGSMALGWLMCWVVRPSIKPTIPTFIELQTELVRRGYDIGPAGIDGRIGRDTVEAWEKAICDKEASKWNFYYKEK